MSRREPAAWVLLLSGCMILMATSCGSPSLGSSGAAATQGATVVASPNDPRATETALFEATNRKLSVLGRPTLAPGTNPLQPFAGITYPPEDTTASGPTPTPQQPSCGATIAGWQQLYSSNGGFEFTNTCVVLDSQLVISTAGVNGGPGAIATYRCLSTDSSCLAGEAPSATGAAWSVYPAPFPEGVRIYGFVAPDTVLLIPESCFNLTSHTYDLNSKGCWPS